MKTTEKIAMLYLRLNGFFLMPYFTTFIRNTRHMDILGIRPKGSKEQIDGKELYIDEVFLSNLGGKNTDIRIIAEVTRHIRSETELFPSEKMEYCKKIFGDSADEVKKVLFYVSNSKGHEWKDGVLVVPMNQCNETIMNRFNQMESKKFKKQLRIAAGISKTGSWNWSEEFLADLLYLKKIGFIK